jgi:hypothetical protein
MNTRTRVAAAVTGSVAIVAAVLVAAPSVAATDLSGVVQPGPGTAQNQQNARQSGVCDGTAAGRGNGQGKNGQGMNGQGNGRQGRGAGMGAGGGAGMGADLTNVASGTLTATQKTSLAAMAEEEKLAHDLYVTLAARYGTTPFSRISNAETRHLTEVRLVLTRYNITDPTAGKAVGTFATPSTQQLYNKLVAQGTASVDGAYAAARTVEKTDIADLNKAKAGVTAPDVLAVYSHLLAGSQRHLVAFGG